MPNGVMTRNGTNNYRLLFQTVNCLSIAEEDETHVNVPFISVSQIVEWLVTIVSNAAKSWAPAALKVTIKRTYD